MVGGIIRKHILKIEDEKGVFFKIRGNINSSEVIAEAKKTLRSINEPMLKEFKRRKKYKKTDYIFSLFQHLETNITLK